MPVARRKTSKTEKIRITPITASEIIADLGITEAEMRYVKCVVAEARRPSKSAAIRRRSAFRVAAKDSAKKK